MIAVLLAAAVLAGILYQVASAAMVGRRGVSPRAPAVPPAVTILKPLYGAEPRLAENLATFLAQDYAGGVQIVCGVARADDAAVAAVRSLQASNPQADIALVVDPARHGGNAKISNLINMMTTAKHEVLIASDSDIAVAPDYLARVVMALDVPGVGAVSCLYHGRGDAGGLVGAGSDAGQLRLPARSHAWARLRGRGAVHGIDHRDCAQHARPDRRLRSVRRRAG